MNFENFWKNGLLNFEDDGFFLIFASEIAMERYGN